MLVTVKLLAHASSEILRLEKALVRIAAAPNFLAGFRSGSSSTVGCQHYSSLSASHAA